MFFRINGNVINPITGKSPWPHSDEPTLDPPPGCPKKARRKDVTELTSNVGVGKDKVCTKNEEACRRYGQTRYNNIATCKSGIDNENVEATETAPRNTSEEEMCYNKIFV